MHSLTKDLIAEHSGILCVREVNRTVKPDLTTLEAQLLNSILHSLLLYPFKQSGTVLAQNAGFLWVPDLIQGAGCGAPLCPQLEWCVSSRQQGPPLGTLMDAVEQNLLWLHKVVKSLKTKLLLSISLACFLKPFAFRVLWLSSWRHLRARLPESLVQCPS